MKTILKLSLVLLLAAFSVSAVAQSTQIPVIMEIASVESNEGSDVLQVFNMPKDDSDNYFLCVGHLGVGDDIIQFNIDPVYQLFIPLGNTLSEALDKLQQMQALFKESQGTSIEVQGCLAFGFPNDKYEPVTVTSRKALLSRSLEFSIHREDYMRATYIQRSDFSSIVSSLKFYKKLHPSKV